MKETINDAKQNIKPTLDNDEKLQKKTNNSPTKENKVSENKIN